MSLVHLVNPPESMSERLAKGRGDVVIVAKVIQNTTKATVNKFINDHIAQGSQIYTDDARQYTGTIKGYRHGIVNHSKRQFVSERDMIIEPINATPEEVARKLMRTPPKKNWDELKKN